MSSGKDNKQIYNYRKFSPDNLYIVDLLSYIEYSYLIRNQNLAFKYTIFKLTGA